MKRIVAFLLIACLALSLFTAFAFAAEETTAASEEAVEETEPLVIAPAPDSEEAPVESIPAATEELDIAPAPDAEEDIAPAPVEEEGPGAIRIILLVMQILSCVVLTVVIMLQSSKESGLGALTGNSGNYMGNGKGATLDAKLGRITKWIAAAFVLLTLIVSLLYTAG